jgi:hypothetical protein
MYVLEILIAIAVCLGLAEARLGHDLGMFEGTIQV